MGKVPTATAITEMKRKKKGRPSKNPVPIATPPKPPVPNSTSRRSTRRNPNHFNSPPQPEFDDDDDERKEKKVKLVVRLPQSDDKSAVAEKNQPQQQGSQHSHDSDSGSEPESGSESDPEDEDRDGYAKKRKIIGVDRGSDDEGLDQEKEVVKGTETPPNGSPLDSGPTTPLPEKKLLVFILDRLQKKDTYRVFSEPVDPDELPDYFDIIKQPMDFGTVRKKLDDGLYKNLEELEADVCLICSNAMEYNGSDTVYFRQARSIQELAKRDFNNLRSEGDDGAPQPKVVRRGRPPSNKNQKKPLEASPVDRVGTELSSGATLANGEDKATGSNSYNLRKAVFRSRYNDQLVSSYGWKNGENHSELLADWNNEFPASILRADMKHSKKLFTVDENKRDTYREFLPLSSGNSLPILYMKRLVPVGLHETLTYARSLARYAANLGPVAWKLASKKIETALPAGVQYGPGWVGDNGTPLQPLPISIENQKSSYSPAGDSSSNKLMIPSTSDHLNSTVSEGLVEAVRKLNSQNELKQGDTSWRTQFPPQQKQSNRNGFTGMFGHNLSAERVTVPSIKVETGNVIPEQPKSPESSNNAPSGFQTAQVKASNSNGEAEPRAFVKSSWPVQQRHGLAGPPDLNVRVPAGSPGPSLQISSPQQPDLALQL